MIISVYVFFTIAATKVAGYTLVVMPIAYVFFGLLISFLYKQIQAKLSISILPLLIAMVALLIFQNLNFSRIKADHDISGSDWRSLRYSSKKANAALYKRLALDYKDNKIAIIGFEHFDQIDCLFYTDANCYANGLRDEEIAKLRKNGYDIGVFRNYIPKNLIEDSSVVILPYDYSH